MVSAGHSLPQPPTVLDKVSLWISPEWHWEESRSDTITQGSGEVLSLLPAVILNLGQACSCHTVSAATTTLAVSLHPQSLCLLSPTTASSFSSVLFTVSMVPRVREAAAPSPVSTAVPGSWLLAVAGCTAPPRAEGTETHLGTKVQALWRRPPKEDIFNFSKWLPPQIWGGRSAGWGCSSDSCSARRAWATYSQDPCRQADSCPLTDMPRTLIHVHTHLHMLSFTLGWIFELIALWFSCKTGPGLGASGRSFQWLCSHLGSPWKCFEWWQRLLHIHSIF